MSQNNPANDEILKRIESFDFDSMLEDLKDDADFNEYLGRVPIEDDDELFELKTFYNEFLLGFDFEEIKQFYLKSNEKSLVDIIQDYFDFKILNEKNVDVKFNLYADYLGSFFFYCLNVNHFDEALSYIIQLAILSSNEEDVGDGDIIERKPRFMDILYEINRFLDKNPSFDLNTSFKLAVDNFKVNMWLNNEDEVFDAFSKLL